MHFVYSSTSAKPLTDVSYFYMVESGGICCWTEGNCPKASTKPTNWTVFTQKPHFFRTSTTQWDKYFSSVEALFGESPGKDVRLIRPSHRRKPLELQNPYSTLVVMRSFQHGTDLTSVICGPYLPYLPKRKACKHIPYWLKILDFLVRIVGSARHVFQGSRYLANIQRCPIGSQLKGSK